MSLIPLVATCISRGLSLLTETLKQAVRKQEKEATICNKTKVLADVHVHVRDFKNELYGEQKKLKFCNLPVHVSEKIIIN